MGTFKKVAICTLSGFGLEGREQRNRKGVSQLRNENQHVSLDELKRFGGVNSNGKQADGGDGSWCRTVGLSRRKWREND